MTMTKQGIVLAILLAMMVPLKAQSINAFVLAGTAASQVEGDELKGFNHWGLHGGVGAWIGFDEKERWGMSIETDYFQQPGRESDPRTRLGQLPEGNPL